MSLPKLSGIASTLGRGDRRSLSRDLRMRTILPRLVNGLRAELRGRWMGPTRVAQSISIYTPWSQQFGKHRDPPPSSSAWPLGCDSGSLEGHPSAFPLGTVSTCPATPPFPCICTGNLVICLPLVPQDRMGWGLLLAALLHNTAQIL